MPKVTEHGPSKGGGISVMMECGHGSYYAGDEYAPQIGTNARCASCENSKIVALMNDGLSLDEAKKKVINGQA